MRSGPCSVGIPASESYNCLESLVLVKSLKFNGPLSQLSSQNDNKNISHLSTSSRINDSNKAFGHLPRTYWTTETKEAEQRHEIKRTSICSWDMEYQGDTSTKSICFHGLLAHEGKRQEKLDMPQLTQKPLRPQTTRAIDIENIESRTTKLMLGFSNGERSAIITDDWRDSSGAAFAVDATASTPCTTSAGATNPSDKEHKI